MNICRLVKFVIMPEYLVTDMVCDWSGTLRTVPQRRDPEGVEDVLSLVSSSDVA